MSILSYLGKIWYLSSLFFGGCNDNENFCMLEYVFLTLPTVEHWIFFADNDECQLKTDNCDKATTTCTNTVGSFTCECKKGYSKESASKCTGQK